MTTVILKTSACRNFSGKFFVFVFCVRNIFPGPGYCNNILLQTFAHVTKTVEKMGDLHQGLCAHGFHMYRVIWEVAVEEVFDWETEPGNAKDSMQWSLPYFQYMWLICTCCLFVVNNILCDKLL